MKPTKHIEINNLLTDYVERVKDLLGDNLVGIYLTGSLTYDAFNPLRSDIDLLVIVKDKIDELTAKELHNLHLLLEEDYPSWRNRIEASYTPVYMLREIEPPKEPRPYYGNGQFYFEATYGYEWIINCYLAYKYSIKLFGKEYREISPIISIEYVKDANRKDFIKEIYPLIQNSDKLDNAHEQSYIVLNICRILFAEYNDDLGSKIVACEWVKQNIAKEWKDLINAAEQWRYGAPFDHKERTIEFIKFAYELLSQKK